MSEMSTAEDAVNALVVEIRVLEGTYNELSARQNLLERAMLEGRAALDAIKGLSGQDSGEVLTQVGGGIMLRSSPPETERVLVSIGANVVVEKSRDEAVAILEERGRDIEKTLVSLVNQRNEIAQRLNSDREVLNSYMARSQQG
ncbi:MAG: prefoldin subunit alpha [Nitrososphaerota archaeon]|jgi:prefoldin alpha subunit|nr:prefoldin subunit alpha [Nitrososphaerota archaeon]MDG6913478.1 prefoldin subunit alpha [Nitrososphaerota archaeon]MDG6919174.1 prefoldin subunit alpha [Nitrososphaerota archaeon]MDG6920578.1 prefoldin subunit alpha [Nitrososphaerota archaeon]MDG6937584.1 prefoldin subunit alpha [Nitrososphaerota archaeon]